MDRRAAIQIADRVLLQAGIHHAFLNNAALTKPAGRKVWVVVYDTAEQELVLEEPRPIVVEVVDETGEGRVTSRPDPEIP